MEEEEKGGQRISTPASPVLTASRENNLARMAPFLDRPTPDWLMTLDDLRLFTLLVYSFTRLLVTVLCCYLFFCLLL